MILFLLSSMQRWDGVHLCSGLWDVFSLFHLTLCEKDEGKKNNDGRERAVSKETMCHAVLKMSPNVVTLTGLHARKRAPHSV